MRLKGLICRILAITLALIMLAASASGCAPKLGKPLLTIDDSEISVNIFQLYLSRMKGTLCSAALFGNAATEDSFWDTLQNVSEKRTYNQHYTEMVLDSAKNYVAALALFKERGLKLPDSYVKEVDERMQKLLDDNADGSKTTFNALISDYGVNYDMLREAYLIDAKIEYLKLDLFGENGSKISANVVEDYYQNNYIRFKQVFFYTYEYLYVTDDNGDAIYFRDDDKISYDTSKTAKKNDNGEYVLDKNGDRIFVYTDEDGKERIAYKKAGAVRQSITDEKGNAVTRPYNSTEMEILTQQASDVLSQVQQSDPQTRELVFDTLINSYNEDLGAKDYPNGYYIAKWAEYASPEVMEALNEMEIGQVKLVKSDYGIHILMRLAPEAGAYSKEENKELFISNKTSAYLFADRMIGSLLTEYLASYKERVKVDEKLYSTVDIKRAGINYDY